MEGGDDLLSTLENHLCHTYFTRHGLLNYLIREKKVDTLSVSDSPDGFVSYLPYIPYY